LVVGLLIGPAHSGELLGNRSEESECWVGEFDVASKLMIRPK
jgi:hypothetical protein